MDLHSRFVVHWRASNTQDSSLFCLALSDALALYPPPLIFHSDKYGCRPFRRILRSHRIAASMTGKGGYKDNIHMERFLGSFKNQWTRMHAWDDIWQAIVAIREWVNYYNHERSHQACQGKSPAEPCNIQPNQLSPADQAERISSSSACWRIDDRISYIA